MKPRLLLVSQPNDSQSVLASRLVTDDKELFASWLAGEREAGEELIERHYDSVARFLRTKAGAHADDLVQRVFLVCLDKGAQFRGDSSFRAFLFGIARNVVFEFIRGKVRDAARAVEDVGSSSIMDLAPGLSTIAIQRAEQRLLVEALQRLPLDLQMAIELYYWEELSVSELAEALEIPAGTVKSRLHRARELLRDEMNRLPGSDQERESLRSMFQLDTDSDD
ncbi:MAG: RNA polymerase sigma factor [Myxococcales bacterium]|nr:RNA polymerase sigma factor [Myxococcales bacterium]